MIRERYVLGSTVILLLACVAGAVLAQGSPPPTPLPPPGGGPGGGPGAQATPVFDPDYQPVPDTYTGIGTVTMGSGESIGDFSLTTGCTSNTGFVAAETGVVTADDGSEWTVPMAMSADGPGTTDIFNNCTGSGDNPDFLDQLQTVVVDEDGQDITAYLFADNYFELYINGELVGRDVIGFTPFNSSAARFRVNYPYTIAVHLADWETHLGLGMEYDTYHIGDAGFIALFSDGTATGEAWRCLPVYIAPLDDPACVTEDADGNPDSSACSSAPECSTSNAETCRALHYSLPDNWTSPDFDDSRWLNATTYPAERVTNQPAYADYTALFGDAEFIWSQNLDLDNQVLCRLTVEGPAGN